MPSNENSPTELKPPDTAPSGFHLLAKPVGPVCNLDCAYCYFLEKELLYPGSRFRMSDDVLEKYIRQLIESHSQDQVNIAWQGGEPTMMSIDFYRKAMGFAEKYRRPGMTFINTMQTNGTLLTDKWCEFFKEHDFLIGLSLDGPRELHDVYRYDKRGRPTFDNVMRGLRLLQKHGVDYNLLATVNQVNAQHPLKVYRFLRDEAGSNWIQFIPVVERINDDGLTLLQQGNTVTDRSVEPRQFGEFLCTIFDEWVARDVGRIYVQTFEATARNWMGLSSSGMCVFNETCGQGLAIEDNGDLYACDHFVEPDYLLGNIMDQHMGEMVASPRQLKFGEDKRDTLPKYCRECDVRFACHGECPKNRFLTTPDGEPGLNYLCAGFKQYFHHVDLPMRIMVGLMKSGRQAAEVMQLLPLQQAKITQALAQAKRNDPCPCGSGRKVKQCHGR
jgi:serine-type anaerobic sulfatase-maturating enzyme